MFETETKSILIIFAILVPIIIVATLIFGRKDYQKKKAQWDSLTVGKSQKEKNKLILGDLLVLVGTAGLIFEVIQAKQGGLSSFYVTLGSIFSMIGGSFLKKRVKKTIDSKDAQ